MAWGLPSPATLSSSPSPHASSSPTRASGSRRTAGRRSSSRGSWLRLAQELVFRDEPVDAEEALEVGLATEAVPDDALEDRLLEAAGRLAEGATRAYAETKRLLARSFGNGLEAQLADEGEPIAELTDTEDFSRGHAAFGGDEDPEFLGR